MICNTSLVQLYIPLPIISFMIIIYAFFILSNVSDLLEYHFYTFHSWRLFLKRKNYQVCLLNPFFAWAPPKKSTKFFEIHFSKAFCIETKCKILLMYVNNAYAVRKINDFIALSTRRNVIWCMILRFFNSLELSKQHEDVFVYLQSWRPPIHVLCSCSSLDILVHVLGPICLMILQSCLFYNQLHNFDSLLSLTAAFKSVFALI